MSDTADGMPFRLWVAGEVRAAMGRRAVRAAELARRLGRSQTWVSQRLNGNVALDTDDLEAVSAALGVSPQQLLGGDPPPLP